MLNFFKPHKPKQAPMDANTMQLIHHGCELATCLKSDLPNLANQPNLLLDRCEEIQKVFNNAITRIKSQPQSSSYTHMIFGKSSEPRPEFYLTAPNFFTGSYSQAMDLTGNNPLGGRLSPENELGVTGLPELGLEIPAVRSLGVDTGYVNTGSVARSAFPATDVSDSSRSPPVGESLGQRSRKRKESGQKYVKFLPAPCTGNLETPPDDEFTWRKYGQKEILGSKFPRSYYRCTHKNFYGCDAKRRVQRLDNNPHMFEVTYCGRHTCTTTAAPPTAPSSSAENKPDRIEITQVPPLFHSIEFGSWFVGGESSSAQRDPSHVQGGKEGECPVVDLADVMFNSGSSSNSMDTIFSLKQEN